MEEKDNLTKAMTLMSSALKQYEEGKFDMAEHSRQEANKLFDEVNNEMSTQDGQDKMRFGESRNFGMLYRIYEDNALDFYTKDQKSLLKLTETIKKNPVLLSEFKTYQAFLYPNGVENPESYVNEAVNLAERHDVHTLKKANMELLSVMREMGLNENVMFSPEEIELFENIEYVITNIPNITNINKYMNVKKSLRECVETRNTNETKNQDVKQAVDEAYDGLAQKCSELTKDEIELVESMTSNDKNAERRFNEVKEGLLRKINREIETSNENDKSRWNFLKENIQSKNYNKQTALVDMAEMIEAAGVIEE